MSAPAEANRYCVAALERGIRILALFQHYPAEISGAAVARELELPRATAFRLLRTLERLGCLERAEGGAYRIGPAVPRCGFEFRAPLEMIRAARGAVERLRDRSRCSAQLVVRDGRDAVVVLEAASPGMSSTNVSVDRRRPAYATILGRMLLCELTDTELAGLYPELALPNVGIGSPRTLIELKQLLYEDLGRGYAVGDSLFQPGSAGVAVPVSAPDGEFVAAVGITAPKATLQQWACRDWLVQEVFAAAAEIAHSLSHRRASDQSVARRAHCTVGAVGGAAHESVPP